jgi:hypothetical protein
MIENRRRVSNSKNQLVRHGLFAEFRSSGDLGRAANDMA